MKCKQAVFFITMLVLTGLVHAADYRGMGYLYLSPVPGAEYVATNTQFVLVRFTDISPEDLTNLDSFIEVTGDSSGVHGGQTKIAGDGRTVIFRISDGFARNERVWLHLTPRVHPSLGFNIAPFAYAFYVSRSAGTTEFQTAASPTSKSTKDAVASTTTNKAMPVGSGIANAAPVPLAAVSFGPRILPNGVSVPADFPNVNITVNDNPAEGYIFIDYSPSGGYTMILDNDGSPVWYRRGSGREFKVQKNGMITWANFTGYDQNFKRIKSFRAVNGYGTDNHELQVLEDGSYLLVGIRSETVDMRQYVAGGRSNARVHETVVQEFSADGDLIFQWRAWDNFDIRQMQNWSYDDKPTSQSIRFPHMNAIDIDRDGHILLSSKRISEITKINRHSGEIIWRLGGDMNQFAINDRLGQFNVQHDIRVVGPNRYTVFDNHWLDRRANSRAVEYEIDTNDMTAKVVWEYTENPPLESHHMGNAQRLPNGNTLINWVEARLPKVCEVRPDGTKAFEMNWANRNSKSYRVFRFPWTGQVEVPHLIVEPYEDNITLLFNKFGDPNVASYNIYGGTSPHPTELLATSEVTLARLTNLLNERRHYFRVTAVDLEGRESGYSNEVSADVHFVGSGFSMLLNGDFENGTQHWDFTIVPDAQATLQSIDGVGTVAVTQQGRLQRDVILSQEAIPLSEGRTYQLEFDAWADTPSPVQVFLGQNKVRGVDYGRFGYQYITTQKQHFSLSFKMSQPDDGQAVLAYYVGKISGRLYLDNVNLFAVPR